MLKVSLVLPAVMTKVRKEPGRAVGEPNDKQPGSVSLTVDFVGRNQKKVNMY